MKAVLKFNLPEEQSEFDHAYRGTDWYRAVCDIRKYLFDELNGDAHDDWRTVIGAVNKEVNCILESLGLETDV